MNLRTAKANPTATSTKVMKKHLIVKTITNKVIKADVFKILKKLPDKLYDLIIIDPPYNLSKKFNKNSFSKMEQEKYKSYLRDFIEPCNRILKSSGTLYFCCDWTTSYLAEAVLREYFIVKNRITWQREKGRASKTNFKNNLEDIFYCVKSNKHTFNQVKIKKKVIAPYRDKNGARDWFEENGKKYRFTACGNLLNNITIPFWSMKENTSHPTQKPEKLMAKLIYASSNEKDLVLDLFAGSGTTSAVSVKMNRKFTAIESDSEYIGIIKKRIIAASKNKEIQGYLGNGCFAERNQNL